MTTENQLPTIPGFFADPGRPYVKGSCALWLNAFGHKEVPANQELETPLGVRIHDWERDWPHAQVAIEEGLELGFRPHVNAAKITGALTAPWSENYHRIVWSTGNGTDAGSGAAAFTLSGAGGYEMQDDSGVRGAVANAMRDPRGAGTPISFHGYGDAGFSPRHIQGLRKMFPARRFTIMELHYGFRGHNRNKGDKPWLYTPQAGAYIKNMVVVAHRFDMACCLFSFRDFFREDGSMEPSMEVIAGNLSGFEPLKPPIGKALRLSMGMLRHRFLP